MRHARVESLERRLFLAAQAVVLGNGQVIPDNDVTPVGSDYTDFGYNSSSVHTYTVSRTYTIQNTGDAALTLGSTAVQIAGEDPDPTKDNFIVSSQPVTSIGAGESKTFTIQFTPQSALTFSRQVTIVDSNGNTVYAFTIAGTGVETQTLTGSGSTGTMQYYVKQAGSGSVTTSGQVVQITYAAYLLDGTTVVSTGSTSMFKLGSNAPMAGLDLGVTGMAAGGSRVFMIPGSLGYTTGTYANQTVIVDAQLTAIEPSVTVLGNSNTITAGSTSTSRDNFTDFGYISSSVASGTYTVTRTFTLQNTTAQALNLAYGTGTSAIVLSGADAGSFAVTTQPTSTYLAAQTSTSTSSTTFTIQFNPTTAGTKNAIVQIRLSDGTTLFTFSISGIAVATTTINATTPYGAASSMEYYQIAAGDTSATAAKAGDVVRMTYTGYLLTGSVFDATSKHGDTPFQFRLGSGTVYQGWDLGVVGMKPGEKRLFILPTKLAANDGQMRIFEVELLGIGQQLSVEGGSDYVPSIDPAAGGNPPTSTTNQTAFQSLKNVSVQHTFSFNWGLDTSADVIKSILINGSDGKTSTQFHVVSLSDSRMVISFLPTEDYPSGQVTATVTVTATINGVESTYSFDISGSIVTSQLDSKGVYWDPSTKTVFYQGTDGADTANVTYDSTNKQYTLTVNGDSSHKYASTDVSLFMLSGLGGNDTLTVDSSVTLPTYLSGGDGNDSLSGGAGDDTIAGGLGADTIAGGDGDDVVTYDEPGRTVGVKVVLDASSNNGSSQDGVGGTGANANRPADVIRGDIEGIIGTDYADTLTGNGGPNSIIGRDGNDSIKGADGDDNIDGGAGNDTIDGGAGNDVIISGDGKNRIVGGDGDDTIDGGQGNDTISAGAGNDEVFGGAGNDLISGGAGNDTLNGGDGNDTLTGDAGNDSIQGAAGDDRLDGGAGDDTLSGGFGSDYITGGSGIDFVSYYGVDNSGDVLRTTGVTVTLGGRWHNGSTADDGAKGDYVAGDIEGVRGTDYNDTIVGTNRAEVLYGYKGNDSIDAGGGADVVDGGQGDDLLKGGSGNDQIYGGWGNDTIYGGSGNDKIWGDLGNDSMYGEAGNDTIYGGDGVNKMTVGGTDGDDTLYGGAGRDSLVGESGNDTYYARDSVADTLDNSGGGSDQAQIDQAPHADSLVGSISLLA